MLFPIDDNNLYTLYFYIFYVGTDENKTFSESCPMKFQSSCEELKNWTIQLKKRHVFIHVNAMEKNRDQRGFLAGYSVNKKKGISNFWAVLVSLHRT